MSNPMPKTDPATKGDVASAVVIIIVMALLSLYVILYRTARTIDAVDRIEQKVNQPCR